MALLEASDQLDLRDALLNGLDRVTSPHRFLDELERRFTLPSTELNDLRKKNSYAKRLDLLIQSICEDKTHFFLIMEYLLSHLNRIDTTNREKIISILSGYDINVDFQATPILSSDQITNPVDGSPIIDWLEANCPERTLMKINESKTELIDGKFDDSLADCRETYETLTTNGNVPESLDELVSVGLLKTASRPREMTKELILVVYHYCSTLGSHTSATRPRASREEAELGIQVTQAIIKYLLKIIIKAKKQGISLSKWFLTTCEP